MTITADDALAQLEQVMERIAVAERAAAVSQARCDEAETRRTNALTDRQRTAERTQAAQKTCRELQRLNAELEVDVKRMETESAAKRADLLEKFEAAIADISARMEDQAKDKRRVAEENAQSAATLRKFEEQHEAAMRHREAEAKAKGLEVRLGAARLAEADNHLSDAIAKTDTARMHLAVLHDRDAVQRQHVSVCKAKWTELDATLAKTAEAMGQYEEQAAEAKAKADAGEAEKAKLLHKVNGFAAKRAALNKRLEELDAAVAAKGAEREAAATRVRDLQARRKEQQAAAARVEVD